MKIVKLWAVAAFALFAFGSLGTAVASAEDGVPMILCLVENCSKELEGTFKLEAGGTWTEEDLNGDQMTAKGAEITVKACEATTGKDTNFCKDQKLILTGAEHNGVKCNTEGDAAGTIKMLLDLRVAAELNAAGTELEPLLIMKILKANLTAGLVYKCGVMMFEIKGDVGCLVIPGLTQVAANGTVEVLCKLNKKTHDPETGKCELSCEELEKEPGEDNQSGKFVDMWWNFHLVGEFQKDIFIDD